MPPGERLAFARQLVDQLRAGRTGGAPAAVGTVAPPTGGTGPEGKDWDPHVHPRDQHGRFLRTGATVSLPGGGHGRIERVLSGGRVEVRHSSGKRTIEHGHDLTETKPAGKIPTPKPHSPGTPTVRPALHTYQRRNITALSLHEHENEHVREGAARLANRQPLSGEQASALAGAVHQAAGEHSDARRGRALHRAADRLAAAGGEIGARDVRPPRDADRVDKVRAADVEVGELAAFPNTDGTATAGRVTGSRTTMGGRLRTITFTPSGGGPAQTRLLTRDTPLYVLPEPAPPKPKRATKGAKVGAKQLRVGDRVALPDGRGEGVLIAPPRINSDGSAQLSIQTDEHSQLHLPAVTGPVTRTHRATDEEHQIAQRIYSERETREIADRMEAVLGASNTEFRAATLRTIRAALDRPGMTPAGLSEAISRFRTRVLIDRDITDRYEADINQALLATMPDHDPSDVADIARSVGYLQGKIFAAEAGHLDNSLQDAMYSTRGSEEEKLAAARQRLEFLAASDPALDTRQIAQSLAPALRDIRQRMGDDAAAEEAQRPVFGDTNIKTAIRRAQAMLPDDTGNVGQARTVTAVFDPLDPHELEAGNVPPVHYREYWSLDTAADGGPGVTATQHLEVIRAAGERIQQEHELVLAERLGADWRAREADLKRRVDETRDQITAAHEALSNLNPGITVREKLQATQGLRNLRFELTRQYDQIQSAKSHALIDTLAKVRKMGPTGKSKVKFSAGTPDLNPAALEMMEEAQKVYPADWLKAASSRSIEVIETPRGYYSERFGKDSAVIALSDTLELGSTGQHHTAVHELGHHMETHVGGLYGAQWTFLWDRTSEGPIGDRTREGNNASTLIYKTGFGSEMGRKDKFASHYTGKEYLAAHFEVFTTGVESLFAGSPYLEGDDDMRHFMLGTLALL